MHAFQVLVKLVNDFAVKRNNHAVLVCATTGELALSLTNVTPLVWVDAN